MRRCAACSCAWRGLRPSTASATTRAAPRTDPCALTNSSALASASNWRRSTASSASSASTRCPVEDRTCARVPAPALASSKRCCPRAGVDLGDQQRHRLAARLDGVGEQLRVVRVGPRAGVERIDRCLVVALAQQVPAGVDAKRCSAQPASATTMSTNTQRCPCDPAFQRPRPALPRATCKLIFLDL